MVPVRFEQTRVVATLLLNALTVALIAGGCGSGGGGSGGASTVINPVSVQGITVTPSLSGTRIAFTLVSPESHRMSVAVDYSENRALGFAPASIVEGSTRDLAATPAGVRHQVTWAPLADLEVTNQADLVVRITPRDEVTGRVGASAASAVFALGQNHPPEILSVTTPSGVGGGSVPLAYDARDSESDHVEILVDYSLDGGLSWNEGSVAEGGNGALAVPLEPAAASFLVYWDAQADLPGLVASNVRARLTAVDVAPGRSAATLDFAVDLRAPRLELLTLGEIPDYMNGSEPYTNSLGQEVRFGLAVPEEGFELAVRYSAMAGAAALDPATLEVRADRALGPGGNVPAGTDVGDLFAAGAAGASWYVPASHRLPLDEVTFEATIRDVRGNVSNTGRLSLRGITAGALERPFDTVDRWWLNFASDYFDIEFTGGATVTVDVAAGGDGVADYEEDLAILGLRSDSPTTAAAAIDTNGRVLALVKEETLGRLRELYGGDFDGDDAGYSENLEFSLSSTDRTSSIRIGGDDANSGFAIGRAAFDQRNATGNLNESTILGVFTTNMIDFYINSSYSFKSQFDWLIPGRGTPVGEHALDDDVLADDFDRLAAGNTTAENQRYDRIWIAIHAWGRSVAVVAAHEIGHSLGMCANGAPPAGLFGNVTGPAFAGPYTNSFHFDSPGNNIMASSLAFAPSINSGPTGYRFNELEIAYLREWTLLTQ